MNPQEQRTNYDFKNRSYIDNPSTTESLSSNKDITSNDIVSQNAPQTGEMMVSDQVNPPTDDLQKNMNVTFVDDREPVVDPGRTTTVLPAVTSRIVRQMPDNTTWTTHHMLERPQIYAHVPWTAADTRNTSLWDVYIPDILTAGPGIHSQIINQFSFIRWDSIEVIFELNSTQFHQGALLCSFTPFSQTKNTPVAGAIGKIATLPVKCGMPRVILNASQSTRAALEIPWHQVMTYISTTSKGDYKNLGNINISVLNPLLIGVGCTQTVNVNIYLRLVNPRLALPTVTHTTVWTAVPTGLMDDLTSGLEQAKDIAGNIMSGNFSAAAPKIGNAVGSICKHFGFDKPLMVTPKDSSIFPVPALCYGAGIPDTAQRLALLPDSAAMTALEHSGSKDEMDWSVIYRTKSLLTQKLWQGSAINGTAIFSMPVTPQCRAASITTGASDDIQTFHNTYLSWVSELWNNWAGSIDLTFEVMSSRFHTGRLLAVFDPDTDPTKVLTYSDALTLPQCTLDLQKSTTFTVRIPFYSQTRYKYIASTDSMEITSEPNYCCTGKFYLYVINPLVGPCNVYGDAEINIWIAGGPDMTFAVPANNIWGRRVYPTLSWTRSGEEFVPTGLPDNTGRVAPSDVQAVLGFGDGTVETGNLAGEPQDFKTLIKRYNNVTGLPFIDVPTGTLPSRYKFSVNPMFETTPTTPTTAIPAEHILSYLSSLFATWHGSMRFMFVTNADRTKNRLMTVHYDPSSIDGSKLPSSYHAMLITNLSQQNCLTVEVPFNNPFNVLLTDYDYENTASQVLCPQANGTVTVDLPKASGDTENIFISTFVSAGDDFQFHTLVTPPSTYALLPTGTDLPWWAILQGP